MILQEITSEALLIASDAQPSITVAATADPYPPKKVKGLSAILMNSLGQPPIESTSAMERLQSEIDRYKILFRVSMDTDPLSWWKSQDLPILSTLAKKYLCVAGTSVPSERLFSQAGYTVNVRELIMQLICYSLLIIL